jgi:hypothetical protein
MKATQKQIDLMKEMKDTLYLIDIMDLLNSVEDKKTDDKLKKYQEKI